MENKFTLVINAGRSGSTYLFKILKKNFSDSLYIAHEDIPVQVSLPRQYNRAYDEAAIQEVLKDRKLMQYIDNWQKQLDTQPVIETGWTASHLAPVLFHIFQERFQYIILHRHPVEFAASRATMGNYHQFTFYDNAHEVSPFDLKSIIPEKQSDWHNMNHFEKCLFWWYVVYSEAFEFKNTYPKIPFLEIPSKALFNREKIGSIINFLNLDNSQEFCTDVPKNPLPNFLHETFPLNKEWCSYQKHDEIIDFAQNLGYSFDQEKLADKMSKYNLPSGILPWLRHHSQYWKIKWKIGRKISKVFPNNLVKST